MTRWLGSKFCLARRAGTLARRHAGTLAHWADTHQSLVLAMPVRALTIQYSFAVPRNVVPPVSEPSGKPVPASDSLAFPLRDRGVDVFDYKDVVAAIQEARTVTGNTIFTPWRDAVGDREKGRDVERAKTVEDEGSGSGSGDEREGEGEEMAI